MGVHAERSVVVETGAGCVSLPLRQKKVPVGRCCWVFSLVVIMASSARCITNACPCLDVPGMGEGLSPREAVWRRLLISGLWEEDFLSRPLEAATRKTPRVSRFKNLSPSASWWLEFASQSASWCAAEKVITWEVLCEHHLCWGFITCFAKSEIVDPSEL